MNNFIMQKISRIENGKMYFSNAENLLFHRPACMLCRGKAFKRMFKVARYGRLKFRLSRSLSRAASSCCRCTSWRTRTWTRRCSPRKTWCPQSRGRRRKTRDQIWHSYMVTHAYNSSDVSEEMWPDRTDKPEKLVRAWDLQEDFNSEETDQFH